MGKKGKAPKGRAAAKQKAKRSSGGGSGRPSATFHVPSHVQMLDDDDDDDDDSTPSFRGFAQKNNSNNNSPATRRQNMDAAHRNGTIRYRHQAISFVSAGTNIEREFEAELEVREELDEWSINEEDDNEEDNIQTNIVADVEMEAPEIAMEGMNIQGSPKGDQEPRGGEERDIPLFVVDTVGDESLATSSKASGKRPIRQRSPSPAPSDSSEEVVLFHGRNQPAKADQSKPQSAVHGSSAPSRTASPLPPHLRARKAAQPNAEPAISSTSAPPSRDEPSEHVTDKLLQSLEEPTSFNSTERTEFTAMGWAAHPSRADTEVDPDAQWGPAPPGSWWKNGKPRPDLGPEPSETATATTSRSQSKVAFAEPSAEETIASLQADWKATQKAKRKEKKKAKESETHEQDEIKLTLRSPKPRGRGSRGAKKTNGRAGRQPFVEDDDDDDDADGEAAYDDYMQNLAAQLEDGEDIDLLTGMGDAELWVDGQAIGEDEVLKSHYELMNDSDDSSSTYSGPIGQDLSDLSSSDMEDELEYTERQQWEDEEDLRERRRERMTDEQIARMFAKQQEFGYHGDDLIIEDGQYMSDTSEIEGVGDIASARAGLANITNSAGFKTPPHKRGGRRRIGDDFFPDATAMADTLDQYGSAEGFDIMDLDRPSLRPTKRGRKGALPPEVEALSDDDLKDLLRDQWSADRRKKSAKKAEREELRMAGLLGSSGKKGKADLAVKYPGGISMQEIHTELRIFLLDEGQRSRSFPPMAKNDRKALHEVATVLKLKSKSIGGGKDRFPTLYKTSNTPLTEDMIDRALYLSTQGLLSRDGRLSKRLGKKNAKAVKSGSKFSGGGGAASGASVRHGEIVGAGAKELGRENFGHKLMEKMGWSKGMALGRDGEGRLVPVEQVVRVGKAGLG